MKKLVLDIRGNGGGIVDEAVNMADEFLGNDDLIVYTEGRKSPRKEYHAQRPGSFESGKLILLVDEGTASASEILAGAPSGLGPGQYCWSAHIWKRSCAGTF